MQNKTIICLTLAALALFWDGGAVRAAPVPATATGEQLKMSILKNPATYDLARSTWKAEEIKPAGTLPAVAKPPAQPQMAFRKVVVLPEAPEEAALTIVKGGTVYPYRLYINGVLVPPPPILFDFGDTLTGLAGYFKKGTNVMVVVSGCYGINQYRAIANPVLLAEGMVRGQSGRIVRILSGSSWKAAYNPPQGCERPDFDDRAWSSAVSGGKPSVSVGYTVEARLGGALSPPYYGPIELAKPGGDRFFIYDFGKPVRLPLKVYAYALEGNYDIRWRLTEAETEQETARGNVQEGQSDTRSHKSEIELSVPKPGVYELFVELVQNGQVKEFRVEEIAVVGKVEQREVAGANYLDGLELELVDEVDCADTNSAYRLFSQTAKLEWGKSGEDSEAPIVDSPLGKYRETSGVQYSWFGFAVRLDKIYQPYLIEVEIPDDKERHIGIRPIQMDGAVIANGRFSDGTRFGLYGMSPGSGGVYTGLDHPLTGRMLVERMVIFVKSPILGIQLATLETGRPAAARKIRIYRITNDLPAAKIASPTYRYTGQHLERMNLMPMRYYAGPDQFRFAANCNTPFRGAYKNWFNTGVNMVKYLRFTGENMIEPGIYMYSPEPTVSGGWVAREVDVSLPLLGRIMAANGCAIRIGVEYGAVAFTNRYTQMVDKDGRPVKTWVNTPNMFDPVVRADLVRFMDDLARVYGQCPGIAGITLLAGLGLVPDISYNWYTCGSDGLANPLDLGYDDFTVGTFEKDTGLRVPDARRQTPDAGRQPALRSSGEAGTPDAGGGTPEGIGQNTNRFKARYEWLTGEKKEQWIEWRNRKVYELSAELARTVRRHNPDWKLALIANCLPNRLYSFDPDMFRNNSNILFGSKLTQDNRPDEGSLRWRQYSENPDIIRAADEGASLITMSFYEPAVGSKTWYWSHFLPCDHVAPSGRTYLREYSKLLSYATPQFVAQTWNDGSILAGHEDIRREFNRAFCVLPPGPYRTLKGNGLDKNLFVRLGPKVKNETPFYAINPGAWPVSVALTVKLGKEAMVKDLVSGAELTPDARRRTPDDGRQTTDARHRTTDDGKIENRKSKIENNEFRLSLNSYEMRSLALVGEGGVIGATVKPDESVTEALAKLAREKAAIYAQVESIGEPAHARALTALSVFKPVAEFMADSKLILDAARGGDHLTVANMTDSYASSHIEGYLVSMIKFREDFKSLTNRYYFVDCGAAEDWIDASGRAWLADQDWQAGAAPWGCAGGTSGDRGNMAVAGAAPGLEKLYRTERWGVKQYSFRLPKGRYRVRLHFAETHLSAPGERLFDVTLNGTKVLRAFDIFKEAGGRRKAIVKEFVTDAPDELLEIGFVAGSDNPKIDAIEIAKDGGN
ncbi:MAG: hypothetical protein HYV36_06595 [Lentisphaerae bacterium]|nr:hypothetical protein [Lentisphaerota bacterium]